MKPLTYDWLETPVGRLSIVCSEVGLRSVAIAGSAFDPSWIHSPRAIEPIRRQLEEYFAGERTGFDFVRDTDGTAFQESVWSALIRIPHGTTASYGEIAARIGKPGSSRAVGTANGANPLLILVPCHRVIGSDGRLAGFSGGLHVKRWLLDHEMSFRPILHSKAARDTAAA